MYNIIFTKSAHEMRNLYTTIETSNCIGNCQSISKRLQKSIKDSKLLAIVQLDFLNRMI